MKLTIIAASLFLILAFVAHKDTSIPHTPIDTLPKYRQIVVLVNPGQYILSQDSITRALQQYAGVAMTVSESRQYLAFVFKHLSLMEQAHARDSVLLETKPVVKKGGK